MQTISLVPFAFVLEYRRLYVMATFHFCFFICLLLVFQLTGSAQSAYVPDTLFGTFGFDIPRAGLFRGMETYKTPDHSFVTIGQNGSGGIYAQKLKRCGTLDSSFGTNGVVSTKHKENSINALFGAVDGNGKIYLGGTCRWSNLNYDLPYLIRLNPNGSVDEQFGDTGRVIFNVQSSVANAARDLETVRILPDGKILCGGGTRENFFVARLLPNGDFDSGFGTNGILYLNPSLPNQNAVTKGRGYVLSDSTMILTKSFYVSGTDVSTCLAKVKKDGTFDTQLGTGGLVNLGDKSSFTCIDRLGAKIVGLQTILGLDSTRFYFRRFNTDLTIDNSFGNQGGMRVFGIENAGNSFVENPDGSFYVVGAAFGTTGTKGLIRKYNPDFTIAGTFGTDGTLIFKNNSGSQTFQRAGRLFLEPGNTLFTVGSTGQSGNNVMGIVYNSFVPGSNVPKLKFNNPLLNCTGNGDFEWYRANILIPGASGNAYQPTTSGSHKARITDARGCRRFSNAVNVVVTALEDPLSSKISLFPNPASDHIQISSLEMIEAYQITGLDGKMVQMEVVHWLPGDHSIKLRNLHSGLYYLSLSTPKSKAQFRLLVP